MSGRPVNFMMTNKRRIARSNWKSLVNTNDQATEIKKGVVSGNIRPLYNKDPNLTDNGANAFKARPLKLYRRQYADSNNSSRLTLSRDLLHNSLTPGGIAFTNADCSNCGTIVGNERVFNIDNNRATLNQQNKCERIAEDNARTRVRGAKTNINSNPKKPKYYTSNKSYLESRCKTYEQRKYNFSGTISDTIKPGTNDASNFAYRSNCCVSNVKCGNWSTTDLSCGSSAECSNFVDPCNNCVYYKPSNPKFAVQGGVSSSQRLLRQKVDAINLAASQADPSSNNFFQVGNSIGNAVAYSSRTETPFTIKSKFQPNVITRTAGSHVFGWRSRAAPRKLACCPNSSNPIATQSHNSNACGSRRLRSKHCH